MLDEEARQGQAHCMCFMAGSLSHLGAADKVCGRPCGGRLGAPIVMRSQEALEVRVCQHIRRLLYRHLVRRRVLDRSLCSTPPLLELELSAQ